MEVLMTYIKMALIAMLLFFSMLLTAAVRQVTGEVYSEICSG